jgi:tRNA G10  N-methylase Trm11
MTIAFILGRTPQLAQKEIEATATILPFLWSASIVQPDVLLLKDTDSTKITENGDKGLVDSKNVQNLTILSQLQERLGGTLKIVEVITQVDRAQLSGTIADILQKKEGRIEFGISVYGKGLQSLMLGLNVKKSLKGTGRSVRMITPKEGEALSTAQVTHNRLASYGRTYAPGPGTEIVLIKDQSQFWVGVTRTVQDIDSYSKRDFSIPVPDPASGMLSPKLAQTMINLSGARKGDMIYDPFCGNGRVVEEALLMGCKSFGSDIEPEKVKAARRNTDWMIQEYNLPVSTSAEALIWQQDATAKNAADAILASLKPGTSWCLVAEPYLGKPLRNPLTKAEGETWLTELTTLYLGFFRVWQKVVEAQRPKSMVLVFPSAKTVGDAQISLLKSVFDRLEEMGYSVKQVAEYGRPDALVNREIVCIKYVSHP